MNEPSFLPALLMEKLEQRPIVQPWSIANNLGPKGSVVEVHRSFTWFAHNTFFKPSIPMGIDEPKIVNRAWHPG